MPVLSISYSLQGAVNKAVATGRIAFHARIGLLLCIVNSEKGHLLLVSSQRGYLSMTVSDCSLTRLTRLKFPSMTHQIVVHIYIELSRCWCAILPIC